ncbi:hypothetical protein GCM10009557_33980 [Virgisporangium ochraceum]
MRGRNPPPDGRRPATVQKLYRELGLADPMGAAQNGATTAAGHQALQMGKLVVPTDEEPAVCRDVGGPGRSGGRLRGGEVVVLDVAVPDLGALRVPQVHGFSMTDRERRAFASIQQVTARPDRN